MFCMAAIQSVWQPFFLVRMYSRISNQELLPQPPSIKIFSSAAAKILTSAVLIYENAHFHNSSEV